MSNILEVRGLCKHYGSFSLNNVSFAIPRGFIMGFIGPNGSGKTTTIKAILQMTQPSAGSVELFGERNTLTQNSKIGVVLDTPPYVDDWTMGDVERALSPFYSRWDKKTFSDYLERFGLERKRLVKELSRGMKVKLQIAIALSHDAELLILDEPTSGLDPVARDEICTLLHGFVEDERKSVFFSTHITSDLEKTADYITYILGGSIIFTGTKDIILEKYARVTGGLGDINEEQRKLIIGYRQYDTGFEGLINAADSGYLPGNVLIEQASLDEIIVYTNKGVKHHE